MVSERNRWRRSLLGTVALLAGIAGILFGSFWPIDFFYLRTAAAADGGSGEKDAKKKEERGKRRIEGPDDAISENSRVERG